MHFRLWNSFNLLAVILLAVGIIGGISGGRMVFDPGRAQTGKEWIIYLVAGALMLVNGFLPPSHVPEPKTAKPVPVGSSDGKSDAEIAAVAVPSANEKDI